MASPTTLDYIGYFFKGYKTEAMDQTFLAFLRSLHTGIALSVFVIFSNVIYNVSLGKSIWDIATWQTAVTLGAVYALGLANEFLRKQANPSVSIKTLPNVESVSHVDATPLVDSTPHMEVPPEK